MRNYINVYQSGRDTLTHVFIENNTVKTEKVYFKPFLGIKATKAEKTSWSDIYSIPIKVKVFDTISAANEWKKENRDVFEIYGDISYPIQFIASKYRHEIPFNKTPMKIINFDMEIYSENGEFPKPEAAKYPIVLITAQDMTTNTYYSFGLKKPTKNDNVKYFQFKSEQELIMGFVDFLSGKLPGGINCHAHMLTGWNIETFDIPYLVNRGQRILENTDYVARISPEKKIAESSSRMGNLVLRTFKFPGVIIWDYIELYKKYQNEPRESYSLDNICRVELGEAKVAFKGEYDNLDRLYEDNFDKYFVYNYRDVELVNLLDKKMGFIDLGLTIMYMARCTPEQIFGTVGAWESYIYTELLNKKVLCPPKKDIHTRDEYVGGYVMDPTPGFHKWVTVYDIASSYPSQIIGRNLSPETIIDDSVLKGELREIKSKFKGIDVCSNIEALNEIGPILQKYKVAFTSNGQFFDISREGILPNIVSSIFQSRVGDKKKIKELKSLHSDDEDIKNQIYILSNTSQAKKILMNSLYGALANVHCRYFDIRIAEAITSDGQVCVKGVGEYVSRKLNVPIIYSDTDSIFLELNELILKRFKEVPSKAKVLDFILKLSEQMIEPKIKEFFELMRINMNMRTDAIRMEAECVADSCFFTAKKRYVMNKVWDEGDNLVDHPKLKIRGIEIVRTSTPQWVRDKLKKAVNLIFETESNEELRRYIDICKDEFSKLPFEQQAFPRGVNFSDYTLQSKSLPIHVRAGLLYNHFLKKFELDKEFPPIGDGSKMKFAYVKEPNHFRSNVMGCHEVRMPDKIREMIEVDVEKQFKSTFLDPLQIMFDAIGWSVEERATIDDFFC